MKEFADDDRAQPMNQQYNRSMLRKDNHKDKGKLWNPNEALGSRKTMVGKSNLRCGLRHKHIGEKGSFNLMQEKGNVRAMICVLYAASENNSSIIQLIAVSLLSLGS